ncbi:MAG: HAMP domain-containing protein [Lachnospiraceae bacterium]|nr:HAMP domain-containing protein [Lachnospiraceae bacterium]
MKALLKFIRKPLFVIITLVIGIMCFLISALIPEYSYKQENGKVKLESADNFCTSKDNWKCIVDDKKNIYCIDEEDKLVYAIQSGELLHENAEILDVTFAQDNTLYCHIAVFNEDAYLTDMEAVVMIDAEGNVVRDVIYYDYTKSDNPPSHLVRIQGLHFYEGNLVYLYNEETGNRIIKINPDNSKQSDDVFIENEGFARITKCHGTQDGRFLVLKNNGEIGFISYDGKYEMLYKATYDAKKDEGIYPHDVFMVADKLYMLAGQKELVLYEWVENDWNNSLELAKKSDLYSFGIGEFAGKIAVNMDENIYLADVEKEEYSIKCELPFNVVICDWLKDNLQIPGIILLIIGIVIGIGNIMKWRLSLLSKQMFSTLPMVGVMLMVVITIMFTSMSDLSREDIIKETIAINEIAAAMFTGEELADISNYDSVDNGKINELNERLRNFVNGNKNAWSRNYSMSIFVRTTGENFVCVAMSDASNLFMANEFSTDVPISEAFYEGSNTFPIGISYGENQKNLHLVLITPIYMEDGSYDAVMLLNASQDRLTSELKAAGLSLFINILLWGSLLILVISLVAAKNAASLRRAKDVVAQIAGGDFSVRIEKYTKDEVGQICVGVNDMAGHLEAYFEERIRNERFYYKFVPEKFRELLHKEKFTDLALGDAQSVDLTILFCDIRAFSMNSEMMTAKENFDFVNKIYGKAGPIVRKYNGFIDKYIGDAVMALFESADDAVNAGMELYQAITRNTNSEEEFGISSVKIGVGIHSGMARIGIVGEEERMSGTVIANTVNISSRIESLTKRYGAGMLVTKETMDRMKNPEALSTRYLGMVQVAGVNEVEGLYEVIDCLEADERERKEGTKLEFREAVRLYHTGELDKSLDMFNKLKEIDSEDKAVELYAEYVDDKIARGDVEHNIFRFKRK